MSCPVSCFCFSLTLLHGRNFDSKTKTDLSHKIHHNKKNQLDLAAGVFSFLILHGGSLSYSLQLHMFLLLQVKMSAMKNEQCSFAPA